MILLVSLILLFLVLIAVVSQRFNVPLIIIALAVGIIFGSDVTGWIYFDDALLSQKLANICLIFILFAGGFGTKTAHLKPVLRPTLLLSTVGTLLTGIVTAFFLHFIIGWEWPLSFLVGTILSSTDAAAVFTILRSKPIERQLASVTEIESASNDPMAIISTTFVIQMMLGTSLSAPFSLLLFLWQLCGGILFGLGLGWLGKSAFDRIRNLDVGYLYVFLIALILLSFGLADFCKASGMLSAFFAGYVVGNSKLPYKNGLSSFTETLSFISNVGLFILLGLLVFPKQFSSIWGLGILLFLVITFISRPVAVFLSTIATKLSFKDKLFLSWGGIRGAVPIVLATYPAAAGLDPDHRIFNIVFFAVTLSILVQGTTIGKLADLLRISTRPKSKPGQSMELVTVEETDYELAQIHIDEFLYEGECRIADMVLPQGTVITMVNRENRVIAPSGTTLLKPGDVLSVLVDRNSLEEASNRILGYFRRKE